MIFLSPQHLIFFSLRRPNDNKIIPENWKKNWKKIFFQFFSKFFISDFLITLSFITLSLDFFQFNKTGNGQVWAYDRNLPKTLGYFWEPIRLFNTSRFTFGIDDFNFCNVSWRLLFIDELKKIFIMSKKWKKFFQEKNWKKFESFHFATRSIFGSFFFSNFDF